MYENQYDTRYDDNRYGYDDNRYGYDDNRYGYDDNRYGYDDNRYGYDDNRYGYDKGYLEKEKRPQIFPANKVSELGDNWWQWIFGVDTTVVNPFTDLGQAGCDVGIQDNGKLFLVGTTKDVTTYPPTGFPVHECTVEKGIAILFPLVNTACTTLDGVQTEDEQRECANDLIDHTVLEDLFLEIDGVEVKNLEQYRIDSPAGGFEFTAVENNPFDSPQFPYRGDGEGVADGFWILLKSLKPGEHTISFSGKLDLTNVEPYNTIFEAGATYNLFVKSGYY